MARAARNDIEARKLASALDHLHKLSRRPSYQTIYDTILVKFGHSMGTAEQVRKMHKGEVDPGTTDVEDLMAVARFYEVSPDELTPLVGDRVRKVMALLGPDDGPDLRNHGSTWDGHVIQMHRDAA
jgi:hypothetical protein